MAGGREKETKRQARPDVRLGRKLNICRRADGQRKCCPGLTILLGKFAETDDQTDHWANFVAANK
jgi:hypothetical protein